MAGTVRAGTTGPIAQGNRAVGQLSDGTVVTACEDNGVIYVYTSSDKVNFTLRATVTPTLAITAASFWSMAIATNNNIYIVWTNGLAIKARLLTYSAGPAYAVGAEEAPATLAAPITNLGAVDVTFLGGSVAAVCCRAADTVNGWQYGRLYIKRTSDSTWVQSVNMPIWQAAVTGTNYHTGGHESVSVSTEYLAAGVPGSNLVFVAMAIKDAGTNTAKSPTDSIIITRVNVNTGAVDATQSFTGSVGQNGSASAIAGLTYQDSTLASGSLATALREYQIFSPNAGLFDMGSIWTGNKLNTRRFNASTVNDPAIGQVVTYVGGSPAILSDDLSTLGKSKFGFMYMALSLGSLETPETRYPFGISPATVALLSCYTTGGNKNTRWWANWQNGVSVTIERAGRTVTAQYWRPGASNTHPWADDGVSAQFSEMSNKAPQVPGSRYAHGFSYTSTTKNYLYQENVPYPGVKESYPSNGSTINTDTPTAQVIIYTAIAPVQSPISVEVQYARDSAFTTSLFEVETGGFGGTFWMPSSGAITLTRDLTGTPLSQAVWYQRQRGIDTFGQGSAWVGPISFTVSHPPVAVPQTPVGDQTFDWGAAGSISFTWLYSDASPTSTQSAYQIIVERNDTGATVVDTGKIISALQTANATIPGAYKDIQLRWKISVWDNENIQGAFSSYALFHVSDKPTAAITVPAPAAVLATPSPSITWTFTASGGRVQVKYRVVITRTSDSVVVLDTGLVNSSATTYTPPNPVLTNSSSYSIQVFVVDNVGLQGSSSTVSVTTSWTAPTVPSFTVNATSFDTIGYISITWTNAVRDASFYSWRVYRRRTGSTVVSLLAEFFTDQSNYEYDDYFAGANISYDYAVVQVAIRFGAQVESVYNWTTVIPVGNYYWLIGSDISTNSGAIKIKLTNITGDSFSEEYESSEMLVIGRGRRVDYGTRWGYKGSLTCQIRDDAASTSRAKRLALEAMRATKTALFLRNPFGDIWLVNVDDISMQRIAGVAVNEFVDATIPYSEVS